MTSTITVRIPLAIRRQGSRKAIVAPSGTLPLPARMDVTLLKAIARAFRWRRLLESGQYSTISDLAAAEKITPSYISRLLQLTLLAPELIEAILDGRQGPEATLPWLTQTLPADWREQRARLDGASYPSTGVSDEQDHLHRQ